MIAVTIGGEQRVVSNPREIPREWISQQIERRRRDGDDPCVRASVEFAGVNVTLATPNCGGGGGGRPPNAAEQEIIDLWRKHHLLDRAFSPGDVISFFADLSHLF